MLEISASDKGILFPSVALTAINDSSVIVNAKVVDGLLVYNTTENHLLNLYKGIYAWNSAKHLWENIVSDQNFHSTLISYYAIEETYFAANIQTQLGGANGQLIESGQTAQLTFDTGISINKENCFKNNAFVVPADGYYRITCGIEAYIATITTSDRITLKLVLSSPTGGTVETAAEAIRKYILTNNPLYVPLTPSIIYDGYLKQGVTITVTASVDANTKKVYLNRKYLSINTL
jgi:hypothetical protein